MPFDRRHLAERLSLSRPGYRLLELESAALPFYVLRAEALLIDRRPLDPISEFVLKAINIGLVTQAEVAGALGLSSPLIFDTLVELQRQDCLHQIVRIGGHRELALTARGAQILQDELSDAPSTEEIRFSFDRLTWHVAAAPNEYLLKPKQADESGRWVLPPQSNKRPDPSEIDLDELTAVIERARPRSFGLTIIALKRVTRAERFYLPVDVAVFESLDGKESQLAVLIDGRMSELHESAIERLGGLAFVGAHIESVNLPAEQVLADDYGKIGAQELIRQASPRSAREADRRARIEAQSHHEREAENEPNESLGSAQTPLLATRSVEFIDTFEHRAYLDDALTKTTNRLVIVSPWIAASVVTSGFLENLKQLLQRGVRVHVGYGLDQRPGDRRVSSADERAESSLKKLTGRFDNFTFTRLGNTHSKQLLFDDVHVSGSFNWLSFQGSRQKEYRHEESTVVRIKHKVDAKYVDLCQRIEADARDEI